MRRGSVESPFESNVALEADILIIIYFKKVFFICLLLKTLILFLIEINLLFSRFLDVDIALSPSCTATFYISSNKKYIRGK